MKSTSFGNPRVWEFGETRNLAHARALLDGSPNLREAMKSTYWIWIIIISSLILLACIVFCIYKLAKILLSKRDVSR